MASELQLKTSRVIPGFKASMFSATDGTEDTYASGSRALQISSNDDHYMVIESGRPHDRFEDYRSALVYVMMRLQTS